jgi:hypothetical protein
MPFVAAIRPPVDARRRFMSPSTPPTNTALAWSKQASK